MASNVPSPAEETVKLTDTGIAQYVELPADTIFVESIAHNARFAAGCGYAAVQRKVNGNSMETYVYEIRPGTAQAKRLLGPIATSKGSDVTVFGSALSSDGMLYLCVFNQNMVIAVDLKAPPSGAGGAVMPKLEIGPVAAPNDVAVDPEDESKIYIAGGKFKTLKCCCIQFTNAARGQVTEARLNADRTSYSLEVIAQKLKTLAGIGVFGKRIWAAQLFDVITIPQAAQGAAPQVVWRGNDGMGQVWLADNIDTFDGRLLLSPAYTTISEIFVAKLKNTALSSASLFCLQAASAHVEKENLTDALWDPEVDLSFSNTFIKDGEEPAPVRLIFMAADRPAALQFEVDLVDTRQRNPPREIKDIESGRVLGRRHFFNEQVTHAAHIVTENGEGYVVCVNFEQPRILLLSDAPFRDAIRAKGGALSSE